jgi:hypothetical protein
MRTHLSLFALLSLFVAPGACGGSSSTPSPDGGSGTSSGGSSGGTSGGSTSGGSSGSSSSGGSTSGSGSASSGGSSGSSTSGSSSGSSGSSSGSGGNHIKTVFLILMENHNWTMPDGLTPAIKGNSSAPYINNTLLSHPQASWCTNYFDNPNKDHPSEPNYIWLEAGTDTFSDNQNTFACDCDPSTSNETSATHLTSLMTKANVTWRAYAEDIDGKSCPITSNGNYATKHVPFLFFSDVVGNPPDPMNATCMDHVKPYPQLHTDLQNNTVAQYNFITPNLCNDMHGNGLSCSLDSVATGDTWLSNEVPLIMASQAYKDGGAIFITWDESEGGEYPIGMIVLSPFAKGNGTMVATQYFHSSMVRTVEEIFGLSPLLNDAANQPDLADLFATFP